MMRRIKKLERERFDEWRQGAESIERDRHGEKVLRLVDGTFLKLFRRKRLLSKTLIYTPAQRFADNADSLRRLGIPCPVVLGVYRLDFSRATAVHYEPLAGQTLRQLLDQNTGLELCGLFIQLAAFIARLHDSGVYFRALHMGNIVRTPDGAMGLIDISDMRCLGKPLSVRMRLRNYHHLLRYEADWSRVSPEVRRDFIMAVPRP